jgi:hypothetical protein
MGLWAKLDRSAGLAGRMAETLGVDMAAAITAAPETEAGQYRAMVMRCATCRCQDDCDALLSAQDHLDAAPDYCMNKPELDRRAHRG